MSRPPSVGVQVRAGFYALSAALNTSAAFIILYKIKKSRRFSPYKSTLLSLAIADSLLGYYGAFYNTYISISRKTYRFGGVGYQFGFNAEILNILLITFERFISIYFPYLYDRWFTRKKLSISIVCIWLATLVISSLDIILELSGFPPSAVYPFVVSAEVYSSVFILLIAYVLMYMKMRLRSKIRAAALEIAAQGIQGQNSVASPNLRALFQQKKSKQQSLKHKPGKSVTFIDKEPHIRTIQNSGQTKSALTIISPTKNVSKSAISRLNTELVKKKRRGARILHVGLAITASFAIAYIPYATVWITFKSLNQSTFQYFSAIFLLAPCNSIVNGLAVLIHSNRRYLTCKLSKKDNSVTLVT